MSLKRRIERHLRFGDPIVVNGRQDVEYAEYLARQITGERLRFEENHKRMDGATDKFTPPEITVYDCADLHPDVARTLVEDREPVDWLTAIVDGGGGGEIMPNGLREAKPRGMRVVVVVHPSRWELAVRAFQAMGHKVVNADAPFTPVGQLWGKETEVLEA